VVEKDYSVPDISKRLGISDKSHYYVELASCLIAEDKQRIA
jgi:hypothetical protein